MKFLIIASMLVFGAVQAQQPQQQAPQQTENDYPEQMIENSLIFRKYDQALFDRAQAEGKPILVIISKGDCPNCRLQAPTLQKILKESEYKDIEVFQIDFINQPDLAKKFNAPGWTLLIGFKGKMEVNRQFALKSPSELKQFLKSLK